MLLISTNNFLVADLVQPSDPRSEDPKAGLAPEQSQHLVQYMHHVAYNIVDTYINTRLERAKMVVDDEEEEDEIDASFKDWETFADQLICVGALGRLNPQPCLLKLQQLASERFATFKTYFNGSGADGKINR